MSLTEIIIAAAIALLLILTAPTILERIRAITLKLRSKHSKRKIKEQISLLVPFRADDEIRAINWELLKNYWEIELPEAELIVETDRNTPFCKTAAVNRAFRKSRGDIVVILDADCLIDPEVIRQTARNIRQARREGYPLWYIPYRQFYRLVDEATEGVRLLLAADEWVEDTNIIFRDYLGNPPKQDMWEHEKTQSSAHWFGALIQIMPREAFEAAGGMDENFIGWGGEDVSFMHAVDTMYGKHRTYNSPVYHLWHPTINSSWGMRLWKGQKTNNGKLAAAYDSARGDRARMKKLIGNI